MESEELALSAGFTPGEVESMLKRFDEEPEPNMEDDKDVGRMVGCNCPSCGFEFEVAA